MLKPHWITIFTKVSGRFIFLSSRTRQISQKQSFPDSGKKPCDIREKRTSQYKETPFIERKDYTTNLFLFL